MRNLKIILITIILCITSIIILFRWPLALGSLAAWVTTGSFVLQVLHIVKNRDTSGLSTGMWAALFFGVSCWSVYGLKQNDYPLLIANGITAVMALTVIILKAWNEHPRRKLTGKRRYRRISGVILKPRIRKLRPLK
ncbi:SemiSWEET family sugar transporter [Yersinia enterocolitica]